MDQAVNRKPVNATLAIRRFATTVRRATYRAEWAALRPRGLGMRGKIARATRAVYGTVQERLAFAAPVLRPFKPLVRLAVSTVRSTANLAQWAWHVTFVRAARFIKRVLIAIYARLFANRKLVRGMARMLVRKDGEMPYFNAGKGVAKYSQRLIERRIPLVSGLVRRTVRAWLLALLAAQMAAGNVGNMITMARVTNLALRPMIRGRRSPDSFLYFQALFHGRQYHRIVREFPSRSMMDSHYINHLVGVSHLYGGDIQLARFYLERAIVFHDRYFLDFRMLGRVHLMLGDFDKAALYFKRSVELSPNTVMAHQNYAGRYDIANYVPKDWELTQASRLLVYDNFGQLAEDYFLLGDFERSFRCYQRMLDSQKQTRKLGAVPHDVINQLKRINPRFDKAKPIRLLPYEWVTQFGHIGLLDSYIKMARLGFYPDANYVLLAPKDKVVNSEYLAYWDEFFTIVRDDDLVDELFPFQRAIGDNFMAYPGSEGVAEAWTRAAARAQAEWARQGRAPLLQVSEEDRALGEKALRKLGVPEGAWYVGLHVREGGYYGESSGGMSTHRNSQVADYLAAVKAITDAGGYVIRLGDKTMRPLPVIPGLIDYALSAEKSARMDIFFCGTSRFVIGTTSGLTTACISFGTPMLLVNCISNDWQLWSGETDFILKRIRDIRNKRFLPFAKAFTMPVQGYLINSHTMRRHGLEAVPNSADEIEEAVRYKLDLLDGEIQQPDEKTEPMRSYWRAMASNTMMFGGAHPVAPWLDRHPDVLVVAETAPAPMRSKFAEPALADA